MRENSFQSNLIKELKTRYPGCVVLKNDPRYKKGIPDLTVLYKSKWAVLECKKDEKASKRPGQENYVARLDKMSFSRFIDPNNKEEVLNEMDAAFKLRRNPRISERE